MTDEYMTTREAAQMLRLSEQTVARYAAQGRIGGAEKAGNRYRFLRAEFKLLPDPKFGGIDRPHSPERASTGRTVRRPRPHATAAPPNEGSTLAEKLAAIRRKYAA